MYNTQGYCWLGEI